MHDEDVDEMKTEVRKFRKPGQFRWADMKTVFVTVGTTSFDELIESITSSEATQVRKVTWGVIEDVTSVQWNHWNQQGIGRRAFKIYELPIIFYAGIILSVTNISGLNVLCYCADNLPVEVISGHLYMYSPVNLLGIPCNDWFGLPFVCKTVLNLYNIHL